MSMEINGISMCVILCECGDNDDDDDDDDDDYTLTHTHTHLHSTQEGVFHNEKRTACRDHPHRIPYHIISY